MHAWGTLWLIIGAGMGLSTIWWPKRVVPAVRFVRVPGTIVGHVGDGPKVKPIVRYYLPGSEDPREETVYASLRLEQVPPGRTVEVALPEDGGQPWLGVSVDKLRDLERRLRQGRIVMLVVSALALGMGVVTLAA